MSEDKKVIPYAVGKGNRPKIEEVIAFCLDGELQKSALDFAAYMREYGLPFKLHTSTTRVQRASYKGYEICKIFLYDADDWSHVDIAREGDPEYWSVAPTLSHMSQYEDVIKSEGLQLDFNGRIWWCKHGSHGSERYGNCGCDPNKPCAGGKDFTIFGEGFDGICKWSWPPVKNPDEKTIGIVKRLLDLEKQARDEENAS